MNIILILFYPHHRCSFLYYSRKHIIRCLFLAKIGNDIESDDYTKSCKDDYRNIGIARKMTT
jgi:hypothetical protein